MNQGKLKTIIHNSLFMIPSHRGFTLIELLIAIAIIGVLAAASIVMINPLEQIKKSRDAQRKQDLRQLQIALESFNSDNNLYPAADGTQISGAPWGGQWLPYIAKVPKDPLSTQSYRYTSTGRTYRVDAILENCNDAQKIPGAACGYYSYAVTSSNIATTALPTPIPTPTPNPASSPHQFVAKWGSQGSGDGQFQNPAGAALDSGGNIYVTDTGNHRIQKFDSSGVFLAKWGSQGSGDGQFQGPSAIAINFSNDVYVVDGNNHRIQKFDSDGSYVTQWGSQGSGDGELDSPRGIGLDSSSSVFVVDVDNQRIQKFGSSGGFRTKWGSFGTGDGEFRNPVGIALDSSGKTYVTDVANYRVQKFTASAFNFPGVFLAKWGSQGSGDGQFEAPYGIAVDSSNNVYVTDTVNHRIQKFSPP